MAFGKKHAKLKRKNSQPNEVVVVSTKHAHKFHVVYLAVAAAVIIVGGALALWLRSPSKKNQPTGPVSKAVCTSKSNQSMLMKAAGALFTNNIPKQEQYVNQIKELKDYNKDPNCLYVLVNYYINTRDYKNASANLADLEKVYNPKQGFSGLFVDRTSLTSIKEDVVTIESISKDPNTLLLGK